MTNFGEEVFRFVIARFFFSSRGRHTRGNCDWSSDVCSSDLAVAGNGLKAGGVGNSATPNFIYRWTEREIEKTIRTFSTAGRGEFRYFSALRVPEERMRSMKNRLVAGSLRALLPVVRLFAKVFPRQSNCFAFAITRVGELHPWMVDEGTVDAEWVGRRY